VEFRLLGYGSTAVALFGLALVSAQAEPQTASEQPPSLPLKALATRPESLHLVRMKLFYTGPLVNAELLVVMLEKHGISATQGFADPDQPDEGDLSRPAQVFVPETDYDRAWKLFHAEREDEL
jgi:hypothetical protein